ncbi:S66 peptidase family protein [Streptomyces sp. RKAG293]|uniref:S66 family peptidase n=1 Tax=Streptomyces sp. RKAG293 TaxID=2893403 RepID=UPI00203322AD|nr:S66 peptidase family protein [Streptomyces sp. RKAG293]MCM2418965.1 LD-carboxypeptidase [Streptomyces sp. RKAG293]
MTSPRYPAKPRPGDRVAVLSPSSGLPGLLPLPFELGLNRLEKEFGLRVVEYPATRRMGSTARERAADLHAAFADPDIKAVIASIGGDDQITVLPYLDDELIRTNPKPFFGWSDNTCLLHHLYGLGIVGYHGGSVMVEFGRPGAMHPVTADSLRAALFTSGEYELAPVGEFNEVNGDWADPATFDKTPRMTPCEGWTWHRPDRVVDGTSWGGNVEILSWLLMAGRETAPAGSHRGQVLFLETSEEMPPAVEVYRILRNMGERGLLRQFPALLMGRAKAWSIGRPDQLDTAGRERFRADQRAAVLRALAEYAPEAMAVFDVDLGHTDPQVVIPYGGRIRVDGPARRITVGY